MSQPPPVKKRVCVWWDNLKLGRCVLQTLSTQGWRLAPGSLTKCSQPRVRTKQNLLHWIYCVSYKLKQVLVWVIVEAFRLLSITTRFRAYWFSHLISMFSYKAWRTRHLSIQQLADININHPIYWMGWVAFQGHSCPPSMPRLRNSGVNVNESIGLGDRVKEVILRLGGGRGDL